MAGPEFHLKKPGSQAGEEDDLQGAGEAALLFLGRCSGFAVSSLIVGGSTGLQYSVLEGTCWVGKEGGKSHQDPTHA